MRTGTLLSTCVPHSAQVSSLSAPEDLPHEATCPWRLHKVPKPAFQPLLQASAFPPVLEEFPETSRVPTVLSRHVGSLFLTLWTPVKSSAPHEFLKISPHSHEKSEMDGATRTWEWKAGGGPVGVVLVTSGRHPWQVAEQQNSW